MWSEETLDTYELAGYLGGWMDRQKTGWVTRKMEG